MFHMSKELRKAVKHRSRLRNLKVPDLSIKDRETNVLLCLGMREKIL